VAWFLCWSVALLLLYVAILWGFSLGFQEGFNAPGEGRTVEELDVPAGMVVLDWVGTGFYSLAGILMLASVWSLQRAQAAAATRIGRNAAVRPDAWMPA